MSERVRFHEHLIVSAGTQVVALRDIMGRNGRILHSRGSVGVVVRSPGELEHSYRVRFLDGVEVALRRDEVVMLARYKKGAFERSSRCR